MTAKRGEQILARCLEREGVQTVFFMMGSPTSGTAGACMELGMRGIYAIQAILGMQSEQYLFARK